MAILTGNYEVLEFLKAWGIDIQKTRNITIHIPLNDIVTVDVESLVDVDVDRLNETMTKRFALVELKNE